MDLQTLVSQGELSAACKTDICLQIVRALYFVCKMGFLHLDVKLGNVLVALDGRAKLSDFGMAQRIGEDRCIDAANGYGNPEHIAPEVQRAFAVYERESTRYATIPARRRGVLSLLHPFSVAPLTHKHTHTHTFHSLAHSLLSVLCRFLGS